MTWRRRYGRLLTKPLRAQAREYYEGVDGNFTLIGALSAGAHPGTS